MTVLPTAESSTQVSPLAVRVQTRYLEFAACFPEPLGAELEGQLRLQALAEIRDEERTYQSKTLVEVVEELPERAAAQLGPSKLDLKQINTGVVDMQASKYLKAQLTPLGGSSEAEVVMPKPLQNWWTQVIRTLQQLHPTVVVTQLSVIGISTLAPYLLGDASWNLVRVDFVPMHDQRPWDVFVAAVEKHLGIPRSRQRAAFFRSTMQAEETAEAFIKRLEVTRATLGCEPESCVNAFVPRLPLDFLQEVELIRRARASYGQEDVTWDLFVQVSKDRLSGASLLSYPLSQPVATPAPQPQTQTQPRPPTILTRTDNATPSATVPAAGSSPRWSEPHHNHCELCTKLGQRSTNHHPRKCWMNPASPEFRRDLYEAKMRYLTNTNQPIPEEMRVLLPPLPTLPLPSSQPSNTPTASASIPQTQRAAATHTNTVSTGMQNAMQSEEQREFERFLRGSGMDEAAVQQCMQVYADRNPPVSQNAFELVDEGVLGVGVSGGFCEGEMLATWMDEMTVGEEDAPRAQSRQPVPKSRIKDALDQALEGVAELNATDDDQPMADAAPAGLAQENPSSTAQVGPNTVARGAQTGGPKEAGRVFRLGSGGGVPQVQPELNNERALKKLRIAVPLLRATVMDGHLRNLLLAQLIEQSVKENRAIVLPSDAIIHDVDQETFTAYREQLEGVTRENVEDVNARLAALGIDGRGRPLAAAERQRASTRQRRSTATQGAMEEVAEQLAALSKVVKGIQSAENVAVMESWPKAQATLNADRSGLQSTVPGDDDAMPEWAEKGAKNGLHLHRGTERQYLAKVQIDNCVVRAMLDTGGHGSVVDMRTARAMGLDVEKGDHFGNYVSPGYPARPYAGVVHGPVPLRFDDQVVLQVPFIRVIDSDRPQIILGTDLLAAGRDGSRWNFKAVGVQGFRPGEGRRPAGFITFQSGFRDRSVPLLSAPVVTRGDFYEPKQRDTPQEAQCSSSANETGKKVKFAAASHPERMVEIFERMQAAKRGQCVQES